MDDPYSAVTEHNYVKGTDTSLFFWVSIVLTLMSFVMLIWLVNQYFKLSSMNPVEMAKLIN